jgi:uncharacterized phosphosugar-binding protein
MKKILFYITIALAIFSSNSICAESADLESGIRMAQNDYAFDVSQQSNDNLIFDVCIEDFSDDDDDSDESENKKLSSGKTSSNTTTFIVQNHLENTFKNILSSDFSFPCKTSRHIFFCVFRI